MHIMRTIFVGILATVTAVSASAQPFPQWSMNETCARESDPGTCRLFETRARDDVSGSWGVLPEPYKKDCLARASKSLPLSYRYLKDCIEDMAAAGQRTHRILTRGDQPPQPAASPAKTPAPAAAPAKPAMPEPSSPYPPPLTIPGAR